MGREYRIPDRDNNMHKPYGIRKYGEYRTSFKMVIMAEVKRMRGRLNRSKVRLCF